MVFLILNYNSSNYKKYTFIFLPFLHVKHKISDVIVLSYVINENLMKH